MQPQRRPAQQRRQQCPTPTTALLNINQFLWREDHEQATDCECHCCACLTLATAAEARTSYDGPWNLVFVTQRGSCDPTYNFSVNINDGVVTHPNLVKFRGYVGRSGAVRASVTVQDKYASGSGRLTRDAGRGTLERPRSRWALLGILDRATKQLGRDRLDK